MGIGDISVCLTATALLYIFLYAFHYHRIPMNYLLINLAIADIVYATFVAPKIFLLRLSFIQHPDGVTGTVLCTLLTAGNITWIGAASSIVSLTAIAIERYYAVLYPLGNKGKLTNRKLKVSSVENFFVVV